MKETNKKPYFSIIIPLFNKENFVLETIESVLNQNFKDFELIIVDDASTDDSLNKVKSIIDDRIKIVHHKMNKGLSATRNTGMQHAKSDYFCFLDADDVWKSTFLDKIYFLTHQFPEAKLFATHYEIKIKSNKTIQYHLKFREFEIFGMVEDFFVSSRNQGILNMSCLCVHKQVIETIGGFDSEINYSEDIDFHIRANANFKLAFYNSCELIYQFNTENQITHLGILNRKLPDFDALESKFKTNSTLVAYINFHRYTKGKLLKLSGDISGYKKLTTNLNFKDLNWKQTLLLKSPRWIIISIVFLKKTLLQLNINVNSYSKNLKNNHSL
jgi:glycosyltransferase involved in cell wall biosynthesis